MSARTLVESAETPSVDLAAAFTSLYQTEFPYVFHTLRRLGIPARDLPDVTHDVFVSVFRSLSTFDPSRPIKPWLFGVAFRVASNHRRRAHNSRELIATDVEVVDSAPAADQHLVDRQNQEIVQEALLSVELNRRAVLIMHDIDGHTAPEIAMALSTPLKTVYSRLRLAREEFVPAVRRARARRGER